MAPTMRKAPLFRDALALHTSCGMFLYFMELLQAKAPSADFQAEKEKLHMKFMMGVMDHELVHAAEQTTPPGDLKDVGSFRTGATELVCW